MNVQGLSHEQRFIIAYDAARTLSLMIVRACGYRPKMRGAHYNTFRALETADPAFTKLATCFRYLSRPAQRVRIRLRRRDHSERGG
jgi:hypothetical protein